jgi:hypothetical protein
LETQTKSDQERKLLQETVAKLEAANAALVSNSNPNEKIKHHVKIKEENNALKTAATQLVEKYRSSSRTIMLTVSLQGCATAR